MTTLAYSTSTPVPAVAAPPAVAMRNVAAAAAAARRVADGIARHDRLYGTWICECLCRRCLPEKNDCAGCVAGGCRRTFVTHQAAARFYATFGLGYDRRHGCAV